MEPEEEIEAEKIFAKPMPKTAQIVSGVFKTAEMMGWGYGTNQQAIFRLPAGKTVEVEIEIPDEEVWWVTFHLLGNIPSSSLIFGFSRRVHSPELKETEVTYPSILMHEGWVAKPLCPPGMA